MKTLIKFLPILLLFIILFLLYYCWNKKPSNCCTSPYFVSANAHALIDTYRDLVSKTNTDTCDIVYDNRPQNPTPSAVAYGNYTCTYSAMPVKGYYSGAGTAGYVSFSSVYWHWHNQPNVTIPFRTVWFSDDADVRNALCQECIPIPIVNPIKIHDHSFQAVLVPITAYQSSGLTVGNFINQIDNDPSNPFIPIAIKATDINKINDVSIECDGGYMSKLLPTQYNNIRSSVGVVCEVVLKNGNVINCYVFNNEDGHNGLIGRIVWKEKR